MRTRGIFAASVLAVLLLAPAARAEIDGFILEGMTEATSGFSLDDRVGKSRGETEHVINIEDCEAYRGQTLEISWSLDPAPVSGERYSVKLAEPGGSCPLDDHDDDGGETGSCQGIIKKRETPSTNGDSFEVDLDDITGGDCAAGTDRITTVYVVYELTDATFQNEPIDFQVDLEPPAAPTNVEAFPGESSIRVSWDDDVNTEDDISYRVYYRADAPVTDKDLADGTTRTGADAKSATVTDLQANTTYYFRVAAIDENENTGLLSEDLGVFTTTVPVTDFWEHYKDSGGADEGGFCFIATAAYGSPVAPHLDLLREFRDRYLMTTAFGRQLVALYYSYSPPAALFIRDHAGLAAAVRVLLLPLVLFAWFLVKLGLVGKLLVLAGLWGTVRTARTALARWRRAGAPELRTLPLHLAAGSGELAIRQEAETC